MNVSPIKIDVSQIPDHVKHELAAATFRGLQNFLKQPGGKEALDARIKTDKELSHGQ